MQVRPNSGYWSVFFTIFFTSLLLLGLSSCGGGGGTTTPVGTGSNSIPGAGSAAVSHVLVVVLENQNYAQVVNNKAMPYLNSLIPQGALATNYFANFHPSIPNYFMLTVGAPVTMTDSFQGVVPDDNIVRELTNSGKSWKVYAQGLPSAGYLGPDVYPYSRHHDPFTYLKDVQDSSAQQMNVVPLTQLTSDLSSNVLPNYAMIVPDQQNNAHDCPVGFPAGSGTACTNDQKLAASDAWLKANIAPILSNQEFMQSGLLVITFDEAAGDKTGGGGKVMTLLLGPHVRAGYQGSTQYAHQSLLRLSLSSLGVNTFPGGAASAPVMDEFFQ